MKITILKSFTVLSMVTLFTACKKEVYVDLNSKEEKIVIEAEFSSSKKINTVKISKTLNIYDSNDFPQVNDAIVTIKNGKGYEEQLILVRPGEYQTTSFTGIFGETYSLTVYHKGKTYAAESTLPELVPLDSVLFMKATLETMGIAGVLPLFTDPAGQTNYYRIVQYKNNVRIKGSFLLNDEFSDGRINLQPIYAMDVEYKTGDSLEVELQSVDYATYSYFFSKSQTASLSSAAPANPITNISGGALGYFSVQASSRKSTIVL